MRAQANRFGAVVLALIVGGLAIYKWPTLWPVLSKIDPLWLALGMACYFANYYFRALRLKHLTGGRLALWPDAIKVSAAHGVATYLMPMRTGDLALPVILKSSTGATWAEGVGVLIWARVLDLFALGVLVVISVAILPIAVTGYLKMIWLFSGLMLISAPVILPSLAKLDKLKPQTLFKHFSHLKTWDRPLATAYVSSAVIWLFIGASLYCAARATGLQLEFGDAWFVVSIQLPLQLMPLQGIANAGNHEAGWVAALTLLGYGVDEALAFSLATHVIILFYVLCLAALSSLATVIFSGKGPSTKA